MLILSNIPLTGLHPPASVAEMVTAGRTMVTACVCCMDIDLLSVSNLGQQASLVGRSVWGNVWCCWCHCYGENRSLNFKSLIKFLVKLFSIQYHEWYSVHNFCNIQNQTPFVGEQCIPLPIQTLCGEAN